MRMVLSMRLAVIGCGQWGMNYLRALQQLEVPTIAIDVDPVRRALVRESYADRIEVTDDVSRLELQDVSGVIVATPPADHAETVAWLLREGFPVLCEKPLTLNFKSTHDLANLAKDLEQVLMVGHIMAYHAGFAEVRELISAGFIGKIRDISSSRLNLGRVRQPESVLWSSGVHDVDLILRLMDWEQPRRLTATGGAFIHPEIEDSVTLGMSFSTGATAHAYVSWHHPYRERRLTVVGERGTIIMDDVAKEISCYRADPVLRNADLVRRSGFCPSADEPLIAEIKAFVLAIERGNSLLSSGEVAVAVARVLQQAQDQLQPS